MVYKHFAYVYDLLMEDAPYDSWTRYAGERLPERAKLLDVACGTGTFTVRMAKAGHSVTGVDLSPDMLAVAQQKAVEEGQNITFISQNMKELDGFTEMDAVTVFCDGMNYLLDEDEIRKAFESFSRVLKEGGTLLFDVHSSFKVDSEFDYKVYAENGEDVSYIWYASPGEYENSVNHDLTFFIRRENNTYERVDEAHTQRTFDSSVYASLLDECGFDIVEISSEFGEKAPVHQTDRIFFQAEKRRK
ncbi:class I SAM-dependent DNA methyltransferase [Alteribacter natronophilus]|uniref:class I SAM-dependent DNA methyltransferase n=1 Tax=Alteribacter natronophilus TaxID=2583810 RepID=UPI00110F57FB|nr:class I SAM-dependent methyltransferase [Alteribacter natronophilus]TMW73882.1 class I SAM-dependent methyltransferase [Alteribacter natronophilus]